ncbi:hypothetical protein [Pasteuria penetrans]|uniref:hypothetical protein n=1 Tax=Pasteuria penetrans TaxID=86005 RepID=UPI00165B3061|nr:hypothetical protein [Pasteuria penetrans]
MLRNAPLRNKQGVAFSWPHEDTPKISKRDRNMERPNRTSTEMAYRILRLGDAR